MSTYTIAYIGSSLIAAVREGGPVSLEDQNADAPDELNSEDLTIETGLTLFADDWAAEQAGFTDIRFTTCSCTGDLPNGPKDEFYTCAARRP
jgi:hypothetical protein